MEIIDEPIKGLKLLKPKVFGDHRGYFFESYNKKTFESVGIKDEFVQDNQSLSQKNVLRGLHFQFGKFAQAKLIRVISGSVYDVTVDIRKGSPTYGKCYGVELNPDKQYQLYVPIGFAHGFVTLEDNTVFAYKCSDYYSPGHEGGIMYNDPDLNIDWKVDNPILSEKDRENEVFKLFESPFEYEEK
jgi:dTDP-4-dehydrorhamnose 3,5-epimerase